MLGGSVEQPPRKAMATAATRTLMILFMMASLGRNGFAKEGRATTRPLLREVTILASGEQAVQGVGQMKSTDHKLLVHRGFPLPGVAVRNVRRRVEPGNLGDPTGALYPVDGVGVAIIDARRERKLHEALDVGTPPCTVVVDEARIP